MGIVMKGETLTMKKKLALLLAMVMVCISVLAGCGGGGSADKPLVGGYSNFSSKFSPFFSETAYDQDVWLMTQISLLNNDRLGAIVEKGKTGEDREFNGTNYHYDGPADLTVTENADGTIDYDFDLRDDIKFSDGEPLTADDVIFSMYVQADPTYDGSYTLYSIPIKGMEEYRAGMAPLMSLLYEAGKDNTDFSLWDEETQTKFWTDLETAGTAFAQEIIDYCKEEGLGDTAKAAGEAWGFEGLADDATAADLFWLMAENYEGDFASLSSTETAGSSLADLGFNTEDYAIGVKTGESAPNIEGIQKTGEYSLKVTMTEPSAPAIYQLAVPIAPMHYYGDVEKYDYDNNKFGFDKGDLSGVRAKTTEPMGAGPYKFVKFENGVVSFEANEDFYLGAPKTKNVQFLESQDQDKLNGVITGTIDITDPSYSVDTVKAIQAENSNGEVSGDKIVTNTVDNNGYGYLGMSANGINVGGDPGSDASKNLRKAFATVYSRYRDVTVDSYYGETASVINYPISNTSWAAPQKTDADYAIAFSKDIDGNDIYTSDMDDAAKDEAALNAALGFFEAAGFTVADGKVTAAPAGASLEYEVWIPADGAGDHPSFMMLNLASDAFKKIGITLNVKDLANSADLWTGIESEDCPMWCAAWGGSLDPDMYQVYYSGVESGLEPGGSNYMYDIADPELDAMILDARTNMDQSYRKTVYKSCLDTIIDWAVEVPVYQRQNAIIFSPERVDADTFTPDVTTFYPWLNEIQNVVVK